MTPRTPAREEEKIQLFDKAGNKVFTLRSKGPIRDRYVVWHVGIGEKEYQIHKLDDGAFIGREIP